MDNQHLYAAIAASTPVLPDVSFVASQSAAANTDFTTTSFPDDDLLLYFIMRTFATPPTPPGGWTEFININVASPPVYFVGWWRQADGSAIADPAPSATGLHRLLQYRGAQIKSGSVSTTPHTTASTSAGVPGKTAAAGEWAVGGLFCRELQADMDAFMPAAGTNQSGGTGQRRLQRENQSNLNHVVGDTGGLNAGWSTLTSTVASTVSLGFSFLLEPLGS